MTPEAQSPEPSALTPAQATTRIESLLKGQGSPRKPEDEDPATGSPEPEEAAPEPPEGQESPSQEEEAPSEAEEPDDAAVEGADAKAKEPMVELSLDGKPVQMPLSEVTNGYMRQRDYTRKTQEIAESRQALEQHSQAVMQERQVYSRLLSEMDKALRQMTPQEPNWQQLQATDIGQYWVERARWDEHTRQLNAVSQEQQRVQELQQLDFVDKLQGHLDRSRSWLAEHIPGWRDENRAKADRDKLRAYAKKTGFTDPEIDQAYDPRLVMWGIKAMKYDQLIANKPKPTQDASPDVLRPGVATPAFTSKDARVNKAKRRLAQTGRVSDGIAAIEAILSR
jgi:hypothetical protein